MTKTTSADRGRSASDRTGRGAVPKATARPEATVPVRSARANRPGGQDQRPGGQDLQRPGGPLGPVAGWASAAQRLVAEWGPTVARLLLGLVLAWFGYHELVQPSLWTGYVPVVSATSSLAVVLVLAHGWLLLLLAVAIVAGVAHRSASAVAALLMLEIVISLTVTGGLSDLTMRDVGVLGLAICLAAGTRQRLLLSR
jgi:uncharacterized membrane protein YphA (DoxX/SURF4 family)